ncbi:MAG: PAS domain S-box protein [Anaerolineae bacterium]|nr:PAS domain S-box protein [Anaerolineae bacterium]
MNWQFTPYMLPLLIAAAVSLVVALYAWRRRPMQGAALLAVLMLALAEWLLTYALEVGGLDLQTKVFWSKMEYLGMVVASVMYLCFAVEYTGHDRWLTRRAMVLLAVVPAVILALTWTNEHHGLIWSATVLDTSGPFPFVRYTPGALYWLSVVHAYVWLALGSVLLFKSLIDSGQAYRGQLVVLALGVAAPWVANVLYIAGIEVGPGYELTPLAFTVTGLVMAWGLMQFRLLDLVPTARDAVIESMSDVVVVLDTKNRLVDLNPAAERTLRVRRADVIGRNAVEAVNIPADLEQRFIDAVDAHTEIAIETAGGLRYYDLHISPLYRRGRVAGRLIVMRSITDRKRTEEALVQRNAELQARNAELDAFAHTVAHDLKSPLTTVVGFADMLYQDVGGYSETQIKDALKTILDCGCKMADIIDALLLLAGVRMKDVEKSPLDMALIVNEALSRLEYLIEERQAEIIAPATWPVAMGYGPWVEAVWTNYVSNAVKYGGNPPMVELGAAEQPEGMVRFWVRDNGNGLTDEEQQRLFTPFTRLAQSRAKAARAGPVYRAGHCGEIRRGGGRRERGGSGERLQLYAAGCNRPRSRCARRDGRRNRP